MVDRLNLEGLRYAQAVGETGSFSAAARSYGVSQPALSNGIATLEGHLGERLFTRSTRGVTPTPFGSRLLPLIDRAVAALDDIAAEAERWNVPPADSTRMGVSPLINPDLVARAYRAVCCPEAPARPGRLILHEANMAELTGALTRDELDIIVVPSVGPLPRYEHRVIDSEPIALVDSHAGSSEPIELSELEGKQLILVPDTCGLTTFTRDLLESHDLPLRAYPGEAAGYQVLEDWSSLGLGSAILPISKLTTPEAPHRPVLDSGVPVEIFYEAVWNPRSRYAEDLADLADRLAEQAPLVDGTRSHTDVLSLHSPPSPSAQPT